MKKLIYCAAALSGLFFAASCQQENLEPVAQENTVTYTVEVPASPETKAIGDGTNVNQLVYEVWKTGEDGDLTKPEAVRLYQKTRAMQNVDEQGNQVTARTTISLNLVQNQYYTVLFWAQRAKDPSVADSGVYNVTNLTEVKYKDGNNYLSNREGYAAFYSVDRISDETPRSKTVYLTRPFAQLNIGTVNTVASDEAEQYDIEMVESKVTVKQVPTTFNVATSEVSNEQDWTFDMAAVIKDQKLSVGTEVYDYVAMNYMFAGNEEETRTATVEYEIKTKLTTQANNTVEDVMLKNTVVNVPLKENYRTNIVGNLLTGETEYEVIVDADFAEDKPGQENEKNVVYANVSSSEDFEAALRKADEHIVVDLQDPATTRAEVIPDEYFVNISSWVEKYYFGGPNTKSITINANGNKINFIQNDGDWNYVRLANPDAKLIINDAILTNSNKNTGHWKRNLIRFEGEVEFNNVKSEKGLCMMNDAVLNDIEINVADENYALWITAQGQTVKVDGLNVTATNKGRGIKIADEDYEDSAEKIVLEVKNATFATAKKAAVLVSSRAGADITWGTDNDIKNVTEDKINAVWVDEDWEAYFDMVTVKNATKILEGVKGAETGFFQVGDYYVVNTAAGLKAFAESVNAGNTYAGKTVKLDADLDLQNELWTPIGPDADAAPKFAGTFDGQNRTISNLKVNTEKGYTAAGLFGSLNGTAKNFTIDGASVSHISTGAATDNGIAVVAGSIYNKGNIEGVTVLNATVNGNRYVGAIAGYVYGNIKGCTVKNVTLTATPDKETGSYDNGDKVGAIAGYFASESVYEVSGNVVENATIVGYRDMGVVVGTANGADAVFGNTVKGENFVTVDRNLYYGDKDDNTGEVVGRITAGTLGENTVEGKVTITHPVASAEINAAIKEGGSYTFKEDVEGQASSSNGYGKTGIVQTNGGTIDGDGHTLEVPEATGTWDSAINTTGGTIKNLTIAAGFRGIFVSHNSDNCSKVSLENVIIDGPVYTISCDQGTNNGLEAVNSTFNGWTSYAGTIGDVKFTDCSFGEGAGYAYCRPYAKTAFKDCDFKAGFEMDPRADVTFENCTLGGVALTAANISELVTSNVKNVVSVDGSKQFAAGAWKDEEGNYTATTSAGIDGIIKAGATTINLEKGIYVIPTSAQGKTLTIKGAGADTKIATNNETGSYEGCNYAFNGSTVTFENISINTPSTTYIGYARCEGTYKNCIINGTYTLYGNSVFEDCTFNVSGDVYNIWTWGAPTATFKSCTFNCDGKAMLLYGQENTKLTMDSCTFNDKGGLTDLKAAIEIGNDYGKSYELIVNKATVNGFEINDKGSYTGTTLWANKNSMPQDKLNVVVDGVDVY